MLLLDYQEDLKIYQPLEEKDDINSKIIRTLNLDTMEGILREEARIQIQTLSFDKGFGEGAYKMSDVKKMTAKSGFLDMPLEDRKCQKEPFEECKTRALIDLCNCVPWEMMPIQVGFS